MTTDDHDRTPAEWASLLEPLARRALKSYEVDVADLSLLTNDWNCVFRVELTDGAKRVLRVSLPGRRTHAEVEGEMAWLAALAEDLVSVPVPVRTRHGDLIVDVSADRVPDARMCAMFGWIEGVRLAEAMSGSAIAALGEITARLHLQAETFPTRPGMKIWDTPYPYSDPEVLFNDDYGSFADADAREVFAAARARTVDAIARLAGIEAPRMIHADLHEDNAFVQPDATIAVLDFDDSLLGWPVQDLGVTVWALAAHDAFEEYEQALRDGYERVAPWPEREPGEVRVFAASRSLMMANYVVQDHDPTYHAKAPEMVRADAATIARLLTF